VTSHERGLVRDFLGSLRAVADDYAKASVTIDFIHAQLRQSGEATAKELRV
jgi:hypothetical protein